MQICEVFHTFLLFQKIYKIYKKKSIKSKKRKKKVENFPGDVVDENSPVSAGDTGLTPRPERFRMSQSN